MLGHVSDGSVTGVMPVRGYRIDMNEASNFCDGVVCEAPDHGTAASSV